MRRSTATSLTRTATFMMPQGACSFSRASLGPYKLNGKERDSESGLDMFGARYYGSSQ
jgi:hypothetical protein